MGITAGLSRATRMVYGQRRSERLKCGDTHAFLATVDLKARRRLPLRKWTTTTDAVRRPYGIGSSDLLARLPDYIVLMKPRVMMLAVFTALVGLAIAPRHLDTFHVFLAV